MTRVATRTRQSNSAETPAALAATELRWLADAYEQAQRTRLDFGERLRALLQQRDSAAMATEEQGDADEILKQIRSGARTAPIPLLGWTYARHWEEEKELQRAMAAALTRHPAWPWLASVRGIGPTLACKLLARLDILRAPGPSSFWAYCGLATVPGDEYRCAVCGLALALPVDARTAPRHRVSETGRLCGGTLTVVRSAADGVRVAQPRARRGQPLRYDRFAKKTCYLVGVSLIRSGGPYALIYRSARERLERDRTDWPRARIHLAALRAMEKRFLADLWCAWRDAISTRHGNASA